MRNFQRGKHFVAYYFEIIRNTSAGSYSRAVGKNKFIDKITVFRGELYTDSPAERMANKRNLIHFIIINEFDDRKNVVVDGKRSKRSWRLAEAVKIDKRNAEIFR